MHSYYYTFLTSFCYTIIYIIFQTSKSSNSLHGLHHSNGQLVNSNGKNKRNRSRSPHVRYTQQTVTILKKETTVLKSNDKNNTKSSIHQVVHMYIDVKNIIINQMVMINHLKHMYPARQDKRNTCFLNVYSTRSNLAAIRKYKRICMYFIVYR